MYTTEQLSTELSKAYAELMALVGEQGQLESDLYAANQDLAVIRMQILRDTDPAELGKNEAQREARIASYSTEARCRVAGLEQYRCEKRARMEIARLRVEAARAQLRLLEMAAAGLKEN